MPRIAVLHHGSADSPALLRLLHALHVRGMKHRRTCVVDAAGADRQLERVPRLAAELLSRGPAVLVAIGAVAALAARDATQSVPVLHATVLDPRDIGLTGSNVAGVTTFHPRRAMRQVGLLEQLVPDLRSFACVFDPQAPRGRHGINPLVDALRQAARRKNLDLQCIALHRADADVGTVIDAARDANAKALIALELPSVLARLNEIVRAAEPHALPTLVPDGYGVRGTATLGPGLPDAAAALARYVVAVLRGTPVRDPLTRASECAR